MPHAWQRSAKRSRCCSTVALSAGRGARGGRFMKQNISSSGARVKAARARGGPGAGRRGAQNGKNGQDVSALPEALKLSPYELLLFENVDDWVPPKIGHWREKLALLVAPAAMVP